MYLIGWVNTSTPCRASPSPLMSPSCEESEVKRPGTVNRAEVVDTDSLLVIIHSRRCTTAASARLATLRYFGVRSLHTGNTFLQTSTMTAVPGLTKG